MTERKKRKNENLREKMSILFSLDQRKKGRKNINISTTIDKKLEKKERKKRK